MITWQDDALVLSRRPHGERDLVLSLLTANHGRHAALVKGGASRKQNATLMAGNIVSVTWKARLEEHLGTAVIEPVLFHAAAIMDDFDRLAALNACVGLLDAGLPERLQLPGVYAHAHAFVTIIASDLTDPMQRAVAYIRWEAGLLADLGFGLDLSECASTGVSDNLVYVSPKSGRAVSRDAGLPWHDKLLALPAFLVDATAPAAKSDILQGLDLTAFFLERQVFADHKHRLPAARLAYRDRFGR